MSRVRLLVVGLAAAYCAAGRTAWADDYVVVRGAYYREPSTRVIQPMVEVERDSDSGIDVSAHFLVDAITSASIAAGTATDAVFTETRNEAGLMIRKRWARSQVTAGYRYSAESDYWSHSIGLSGLARLWADTATVRLSLGVSLDSMASRGRAPGCAIPPGATTAPPGATCPLDVYFAGVSYTQVLSPVSVFQISYDAAYLDGFQGNLYRSVREIGFEVLPYPKGAGVGDGRRFRNAIAPRIGYYLPFSGTGFQLNYRYYWDFFPGEPLTSYDPWELRSHTIEGRVYQQITPNLEIRVLYRQYIQTRGAAFWCDTIANPGCYNVGGEIAPYYSSDPKLGPVYTEYPEIKVIWDAEAFRPLPFLRWFAAGSFEVSYGHYFQSTSFGNAHVLQAGYRMPY